MSKAKIATISYAGFEFEGLMLPNGDYAIGVSQAADLFLIPQKHSSREFKALLGKGFQFPKVKSELHPKAVNVIKLPNFSRLVLRLVAKGNPKAQEIAEASIELPLKMAFDQAFYLSVSSEENLTGSTKE